MPNLIASITRAATRKDGPLNICTFPTHEAYESNLAKTGHNFYAYRDKTVKDWNHTYRPLPSNYTLFNPLKGAGQIPLDIDFDLVLSQNKAGQYELARQFADTWHVPLISLEHCLPHPTWPPSHLDALKKIRGDVNVFISEYSRDKWGWSEDEAQVVHHGIDTNVFYPDHDLAREPHLLSVVNDWINRDWCCGYRFWKTATEGLPVFVLGDTPGLSKPAGTLDELVHAYKTSLIFVNTSTVSPIPTAVLEAMASGCCVITTNTCMLPEIIQHGINGFLCDTPEQMTHYCKDMMRNPTTARLMGALAQKTILDHFNLESFISNWNKIFKHAAAIVKHGTNA
jgi:glycosyltransferase involved in cell wall biosynthesis